MSETQTQEIEMSTKPLPEHAWLKQLVGTWTTASEMWMSPDQPPMTGTGREVVKDLGGLWAFGEGETTMPDGTPMVYKNALGFDVSFKEYRGCWFASVSSHLWKYVGVLSADGKKLTLSCVGPNMMVDGETANYRDEIDILDSNTRTLTSFGEQPDGSWVQFMKCTYTRVA